MFGSEAPKTYFLIFNSKKIKIKFPVVNYQSKKNLKKFKMFYINLY